jgi:hypothetical protein
LCRRGRIAQHVDAQGIEADGNHIAGKGSHTHSQAEAQPDVHPDVQANRDAHPDLDAELQANV